MTPRELFIQFTEDCGSKKRAAEALGIGYAMVDHICVGRRGISNRVAEAVERASKGLYPKEHLIWGNDSPARAEPKRKAA